MSGLIEYAFNLNPKVAGPPVRLVAGQASSAGLPAIDVIPAGAGRLRLRIEYLRRAGDGLVYIPQFASGLDAEAWAAAENPVTVTAAGDGWERCAVEDTLTTAEAPQRFARVSVRFLVEDRSLDADSDGISRAMEEDIFGTSDSVADDFRTSDVDGDGIPGMMEYAFHLDPKTPGPQVRLEAGAGSLAGLPAVTVIADGPGGGRLRIEYLRRKGGMLQYTPQFASGLDAADWVAADGGSIQVTDLGGDWERCVVDDPQPLSAAAKRFGRVAVSW